MSKDENKSIVGGSKVWIGIAAVIASVVVLMPTQPAASVPRVAERLTPPASFDKEMAALETVALAQKGNSVDAKGLMSID